MSDQKSADVVLLEMPQRRGSFVVVCEHASKYIPAEFEGLGLSDAAKDSHAAYDLGALDIARDLAKRLNGALVAGTVSRLVYDLNRPPDAQDAMPAKSEVFDIPGNSNLSAEDRAKRAATYDAPFQAALARVLEQTDAPILVTIHSFTPVYHGKQRATEIGVLHDKDARLADALLKLAPTHTTARVERNEPYGPEDGVTRTLIDHGLARDRLNVMLEVRSDLLAKPEQREKMAAMLAGWISAANASLKTEKSMTWSA